MTTVADDLVQAVKVRYGSIAKAGGSCCGPAGCAAAPDVVSEGLGYDPADLRTVPGDADLGLGCGAPLVALALQAGETVLDLGSGPGLDAFLASSAVGPSGRVIGVDMTPEMLERARRTAARAGISNVEFREGRLEALPVADGTVDAVTSNCVVNLVPDKAAVFAEVFRVLKPGGRMVISDVVLDRPLPAAIAQDLYAYVGCVAGASRREDYLRLLHDAGLREVEILKDVDYVALIASAAPGEVEALEKQTGVSRDVVMGSIRSLTLRARKPL